MKLLLLAGAVAGGLSVSACATKNDIAEAIAPIDMANQNNASQISQTQAQLATTQSNLSQVGGQVNTLNTQVSQIGATAQEALTRAQAAGALAEGKFLYSVALTDDSVKFPASASELSAEAKARLDQLVAQLKGQNKNVYLEIQGYTDATGSPAGNQRLGQERAEAVRRYLATQGVPLNRISTISYGEENPVAPNNTRDGRAQNRRVVIQVLS